MSRTIDDIYTSIAQYLSACINEDWGDVILEVEREADDVIGYTGVYNSISGKQKNLSVSKLEDQVDDDFDELYAIMTAEGYHHKWNRATFKLTPDGKFSIDFNWDQVLADEVESYS